MVATPAPSAATWLELTVPADVEAVEAVGEILARVAAGVSVEPAIRLVDEGLGAVLDPTRPAVVRAYLALADRAAAEAAVTSTEVALGHLQAFGLGAIGDLGRREVADGDWSTAWRDHFPVLHVGRRLVIRPTWRRYRRAPGEVVVALDPGMAFGTGLHPTTRLCLAAVERLADDGRLAGARVLDVGCGSGILGLAAARLGAAAVLGLDPDPIAIDATRSNARRNRLARRVTACRGSLPVAGQPRDVVLANLVASLLVTLMPRLQQATRAGGRLIAGGIIADREAAVRRALAAAGLGVVGRLADGDWVALEVARPP